MSGLIFLKCKDLNLCRRFYTEVVGMKIWLEQPKISILKHGNFLVGFHEAGEVDSGCLLTFYFETAEDIDSMFERLKDVASVSPKMRAPQR